MADQLAKNNKIYGGLFLQPNRCLIGHDLQERTGVNTGFGGNADSRTQDFTTLQEALIQHQQSGILTKHETEGYDDGETITSHAFPTSWIKGSLLVRSNTNVRGHSALRWEVSDMLLQFIRSGMTPVVPLRGSISASGDLMPLSYLAGAIQGNPDIRVRTTKKQGTAAIVSAREALMIMKRPPIVLGAKEGLALVNGTAPSATVATLAIYDTNQLALLAQLITCLTSEALAANVEWTHPYLAEIRPHPGQREVSKNQRFFLEGSELVNGLSSSNHISQQEGVMAQDRYAVRTSAAWLGPLLEDLKQSSEQLTTELNSTTDNPIVNLEEGRIHCGGNFQATSVTMAAEKTRLCLQMIGKLLFAQVTELINPVYNNGLPPNLAPDDPSLSFCLKGVDINMAAYQSELGFLANPVSSHVQSAEMHNQSLNSLALISARYTVQSAEIVSMMTACAIYTGLQGVDLRVMQQYFFASLEPALCTFTDEFIKQNAASLHKHNDHELLHNLHVDLRKATHQAWTVHQKCDIVERCDKLVAATIEPLSAYFSTLGLPLPYTAWKSTLHQLTLDCYLTTRSEFLRNPDTDIYLGRGSRILYHFVRETLGVPFYRGLVENPISSCRLDEAELGISPPTAQYGNGFEDGHGRNAARTTKKNIGSWISIIYDAIRDGRLAGEVLGHIAGMSMEEDRVERVIGASYHGNGTIDPPHFTNGVVANGVQHPTTNRERIHL